jgi:2-polyprenyl-3-methyl-5-hydroxy-6-metoxy-1,4-benzoquinol methylase
VVKLDGYMKILGSRIPYNQWVVRDERTRDQVILDLMPRNAKVLNYGCGTDRLQFLQEIGCKIVNYDIDHNNKVADYYELKDLPGKFDVAVMKEVIEHMEVDKVYKAFQDVARVSSGLLITTPNVFDTASRIYFEQDITHVRPYNTSDLEGMLKACGFNHVRALVCERIKAPHRNLLARINTTLPYAALIVMASKNNLSFL